MKTRYFKFDNIKFFLIFLVVIGHVCGLFLNTSLFAKSIYAIIYSFHMPTFLYISGLFSKSSIKNKKWLNAGKYLLIFFLIEFINIPIQLILGGEQTMFIFSNDGIQWFALCLFFSYLITILLQDCNLVFVFILSIAIACISGYDTSLGNNFASSRTIVFYPFFLAGFISPIDKLEILEKK
ncbi:MAG: hypothetical protein PHY47_15525 [Lachnospiraceae bacterium]|nr:hypothetical protein [Lachnospiraceae bacterium]